MTFFFFNDTATTEIYTLSLHDALPICGRAPSGTGSEASFPRCRTQGSMSHHPKLKHVSLVNVHLTGPSDASRSEEHTSELQSRQYLVCRLLLEKKKHNYSPLNIRALTK